MTCVYSCGRFGIVTAALIGLLLVPSLSYASFMDMGVELATRSFLAAPVVVVGKVNTLTYTGETILWHSGASVSVESYDAQVEVLRVLQGKVAAGPITVSRLYEPIREDQYGFREMIDKDRTYVLFLKPEPEKPGFLPVCRPEFALRIDHLPSGLPAGPSAMPVDALRAIAQSNFHSIDDAVLARWFMLLGNVYDARKDRAWFLSCASDPRLEIRGCALAVLCQRDPKIEGLATMARQYLQLASGYYEQAYLRRTVAYLMPEVVGKKALTPETLRSWLAINTEELQVTALRTIADLKQTKLKGDVNSLMQRTTSWDLQYECLRTLSILAGLPAPSRTDFMITGECYLPKSAYTTRGK